MSPVRRTSRRRSQGADRVLSPPRLAVAAVAALLSAACGGGAGIGEHCDSVAECEDGLQCLGHTCVPRCTRHTDCGDGHACRDDGTCVLVDSAIGDSCAREVDCGPGQACKLAGEDFDNDGYLTASCQAETAGGVLDEPCGGATLADADAACRSGTCVLGRCVDVCVDETDCPVTHLCTEIPRQLTAAPAVTVSAFHGCLPARGTITYTLPTNEPYEESLVVPVPGNARSIALISAIDDPAQLVGAARIVAPDGAVQYTVPFDRASYFDNILRHEPMPGLSTLVIPQSPSDPLQTGAYLVDVASWRNLEPPGVPGTEVPAVEVIYKLDDVADALDVHFYFLDLEDHPCWGPQFDVPTLSAATAPQSSEFQNEYLRELNRIFARAGVVLDPLTATYADVSDRPDLDGLDLSQLGDLLALSDNDGGIPVFFVRTLSPAGLQGLVGGPPGPPGRSGTPASGVVVSLDTLCYRSWQELAETTAHEIARALGLARSVEPDGYTDRIVDNDEVAESNLMYFSEFGGSELSADQRSILRRSPALR